MVDYNLILKNIQIFFVVDFSLTERFIITKFVHIDFKANRKNHTIDLRAGNKIFDDFVRRQ